MGVNGWFKKKVKKVISPKNHSIQPSEKNAFSAFFFKYPQYVTDAFITLGEIECIKTESSVLPENIILLNQISDSLADNFIALMKVRLIEFFKPKSINDSANKQLLFELQNVTCDFLVLNHEGNPVLIAHQKLTQDETAFEQKKALIIQRIAAIADVCFIFINQFSDLKAAPKLDFLWKIEPKNKELKNFLPEKNQKEYTHKVSQEIEIPSSKNEEFDNDQDDYCQMKMKKNKKLNNIN
ncbi:hypothetical protein [Arsenophonus sp.]|uniref:hypothetical protein n=1 Tax=Arsenophonus sp. TaxID=1872640 RepID=UPI0028561B6C|nr:hypothetical protein [Arsenophonus sp.]MDR5614630.1 hypothetical protein [Arsenophonus sp.]